MTAGNGLPCAKCGTSEWYANGQCKRCAKEYCAAWVRSNSEKQRDRVTRYMRNNREKRREENARWQQNNPDKVKSIRHRRMARKAGNGGSFTSGEWNALCAHYGNKCLCCGQSGVKLTFDHVLPVSKGGTSDISNGQPLCGPCNSAKRDRHIDYRPDAGPMRWTQPALMSIQRD